MPAELRRVFKAELVATVCMQIWDRKRRVPNHLYRDPLAVLFEEFDADADGHLTVDEIKNALNSEGVDITRAQARPSRLRCM